MSRFEERLLGALKEEMAAGTGPVVAPAAHRPRRRGRVVGLAAAAGVAVVAAVAVTGVLGGPAYAVDRTADGGVEVEINAFRDPAGLADELGRAGVKAVVDYLPYGQTCKEPRGRHGGDGGGRFEASIGRSGDGISFRIAKGQVPAGQTLVLAVTLDRSGAEAPPFSTSLQVVEGAVAACEPTAMPGPPDGGTVDQETGDDGPGLRTGSD
ncbi:hypothetical protein ACFFV7_15180 [Nonomuraea spiralis]|uniref:Uncharacterized protein n=1 Tax=Nonomuraea spiralis TaxID=46182 RepID=A0ABV5IDD4_9ACTN|nr:hypothetical protein [Nonomuraea spiralis]GGT18188.1 hypothetical protein GCM10010176_073450 [Nonomuraea spiralis]